MNVELPIALSLVPGLSDRDRKALIDFFGSAENVISAARGGTAEDPKHAAYLDRVRAGLDMASAERVALRLDRLGAWCLVYGSKEYPELLSEIEDPPTVLFGLGKWPGAEKRFLGFVGPRLPTPYGARVARWLAEDLAAEGLTLVSGMARGIDAVAHAAAVKFKSPTVAVMGCGIDRVYPPEHAQLRSEIMNVGAVVTEFPPGTPPLPQNFPRRNRLIAGLCRGVVLIEAGEKSGARVTARLAIEQSREVYAVPGPVDSPLSAIPNRLIAEGAKVVLTSLDILEDFGAAPGPRRAGRKKYVDLSAEGERILARIHDEPRSADELAGEGGLPVSVILEALTELEMAGVVVRLPDARYVRAVVEEERGT